MNDKLTLRVNEVFYSLQCEGARSGEPSIFVRLQGCSAKHACAASGVVCDTEFESGVEMTLDELGEAMLQAQLRVTTPSIGDAKSYCPWIVWTGGDPLDQLNTGILGHFREKGFKQAIETSGVKILGVAIANLIDHITVSPKVAEHLLVKHFGHVERWDDSFQHTGPRYQVDELRYIRHAGQPGIPVPSLKAKHYYISPHSDGAELNMENVRHCVRLCLENPTWRLSLQLHKILGVL